MKSTSSKMTPTINDFHEKKYFSSGRTKRCMLILTHSCNLACSYCYERFKTNKQMSFEEAKSALCEQIEFIKRSDSFEKLHVDLFGGEPLLNFSLIKEIVEWVQECKFSIPIYFLVTSNGTLLDSEKKKWFEANRDYITLALSYDGSLSNQIKNRGVLNTDTIDFCRKVWPTQPFRMTIPPDSLPSLSNSILDSLRRGLKIRAELALGCSWTINDRKTFLKELRILKTEYLKNPSLPIVLLNHFFKGGEDHASSQLKCCGAETITTCYDVDGTRYPCQIFLPLCTGNKRKKVEGSIDFTCVNDPYCENCPIKHWCPTCYGINYISRGAIESRDHGMCGMYQTLALVTVELQIERLICTPITKENAPIIKFLIRLYRQLEKNLTLNG